MAYPSLTPRYDAWLYSRREGEWPNGIDRSWMRDAFGYHNDSVVACAIIEELASLNQTLTAEVESLRARVQLLTETIAAKTAADAVACAGGKTPQEVRALAGKLEGIALGDAFFEHALRDSKAFGILHAEDLAVLDRYLVGSNAGTDHVELQDIARRLYAFANEITTSEKAAK